MNMGRSLRLRGKGILLNSLVFSKLWYVGAVLPVTNSFVERIKSETLKFIWNNKTECLKREVLYNDYFQGGGDKLGKC